MTAKLFYLVGGSGTGKDSILASCRLRLASNSTPNSSRCFVAHRYITRAPDSGGENHIWLSDDEFSSRAAKGAFAMHWRANGHCYGVGVEIDSWLASGVHVLLNGSREYLADAMKRYQDAIVPVQVMVNAECLRERLLNRGRESVDEIERRIRRARSMQCANDSGIHNIDNNKHLDSAVDALLEIMNTSIQETGNPS